MAYLVGRAPVDEQARRVARLGGMLCDQLVRQVVLELGRSHPTARVPLRPVDELKLQRALERIAAARESRDPSRFEAVLERSRTQVEALAATASALEAGLPERIHDAVTEGLRREVIPVGRQLAEIRGLLNNVTRRLERLEEDVLAERHARIDDLALLVDLISSGWGTVDERLARLEQQTRSAAGTPAENGQILPLAASSAA